MGDPALAAASEHDAYLAEHLDDLIRDIPDFPKQGVVFKDITPLLADHDGFSSVIEVMARAGRDADGTVVVDKVVGMEARGFILAAPVALALGAGFVPVRKAGKLPADTHAVGYELEYGEATLELHQDSIAPGERVLLVDDVLATGGTIAATAQLVQACGGTVHGVAVLMELSFLHGRDNTADLPVTAIRTI
jgi:adenine phosphoribosyltransferase